MTLGGLLAWRGVILGLSRGETIPIRLPGFKSIGQDYVGPTVGWIIAGIAVAAITWLTINRNRRSPETFARGPQNDNNGGPHRAVVSDCWFYLPDEFI